MGTPSSDSDADLNIMELTGETPNLPPTIAAGDGRVPVGQLAADATSIWAWQQTSRLGSARPRRGAISGPSTLHFALVASRGANTGEVLFSRKVEEASLSPRCLPTQWRPRRASPVGAGAKLPGLSSGPHPVALHQPAVKTMPSVAARRGPSTATTLAAAAATCLRALFTRLRAACIALAAAIAAVVAAAHHPKEIDVPGVGRVRILRPVGSGGFAVVFAGRVVAPSAERTVVGLASSASISSSSTPLPPVGTDVAVKRLLLASPAAAKAAAAEVEALRRAGALSASVVPLLGDVERPPFSDEAAGGEVRRVRWLVFPLFGGEGGGERGGGEDKATLHGWADAIRAGHVSTLDVCDAALAVADAVCALHSIGLRHNDLKPLNVFVHAASRTGQCAWTGVDVPSRAGGECRDGGRKGRLVCFLGDFGSTCPIVTPVGTWAESLAVRGEGGGGGEGG